MHRCISNPALHTHTQTLTKTNQTKTKQTQLVGRRRALQLLGAAMPLDAEQAEAVGFADKVGEEGEDLEHAVFRLLLTSFLRHTTGKCLHAIDSCLDLM